MTDIYSKFFQLLRLAIGSSDVLPKMGKEEWKAIYEMARKQSLLGLVFDGVQKTSDEAKAKGEPTEMDVDLLMTWMGKCKQIEKRNRQMNVAVGKASAWFQKKGFRSCLLKGQGNALMYPCPGHRTAGDIDMWVSGSPGEVIRFVHSIAPDEKASYHHIDFPAISGIPVEVHYRPCYLQNPLHNYRLQRYFRQRAEEQFAHKVSVEDEEVAIPTARFNVVYQLVHIYNHLFQEGIGLRQIVDYYYVLLNTDCTNSTFIESNINNRTFEFAEQKELSVKSARFLFENELRHLGLWKFAGALMYVLHEVFEMQENKMIAPMDERRGRSLLAEILSGGNFGQYDKRFRFEHGAWGHNVQRLCRDLRLVRYYPAEALSEPVFRTWHFFWRMKNRK